MTSFRAYIPSDYRYDPSAVGVLKDARSDIPLRAKSVCLSERPRSKYVRTIRSADTRRCADRQFYHHLHDRPQSQTKTRQKPKVVVKQQNRKVIQKVPCAMSVQTLSLPMKYADPKHSTSKIHDSFNDRIDNKTKSSNSKQVSDTKRLCESVGCGKETENKLLLQISEAHQVSDFERILNSNAVLYEGSHKHVWRGCGTHKATATVVPRPRSTYSLHAVSQAYHYLFRQHEESLQPLIDRYRQAAADEHEPTPVSLLQDNWFGHLQDLSEFYEDDRALQQEIETITDRIVSEEVKAAESTCSPSGKNKNFNVNLTDLIGLRVSGEGFSPISNQDCPSPDVEKGGENDVYDEKEWLPSMNANSDDRENSQDQNDSSVDCLAQNLDSVKIDSDGKVPTITFSNCCDGCSRSDQPNNSEVIHLAVPSIDSIDETRPPMM